MLKKRVGSINIIINIILMVKINEWFSVDISNNHTIITFEKSVTNEEFTEYMIYYANLLTIKRKIIFDLKLIENIPSKVLLQYIIFMNKMKPIHKKNMEVFYLVFDENSYIKNLVELAFKIVKPVSPYHIINRVDEIT